MIAIREAPMDPETPKHPNRSRLPKLLWRLGLLIALGAFLLIAGVSGLIGFNMKRTITPPATLPLSALVPKPTNQNPTAEPADQPTTPTASLLPATQIQGHPAKPAPGEREQKTALELVSEATQSTAESKAKARKVNEEFARLVVDYAKWRQFEKTVTSRDDPKAFDAWRKEDIHLYTAQRYRMRNIVSMLSQDFPLGLTQFDKVFLGLCNESQDLGSAINYCDFRHDWDGAVYYCRQSEPPVRAALSIGVLYLRAALRFGQSLNHGIH